MSRIVYPDSWKILPLEDISSRITYGFTNPMPTTTHGPWMITATNIDNGAIDYSSARHTSQHAYDAELTLKSKPKVGDILVTKDGTLGKVALVDRPDICVNQSVAVITPSDPDHSRYIFYFLQSPLGQSLMFSTVGGSTIKHIYITRLAKIMISLPPLPEQRKIAAILSTWDEAIALVESLIAALKARKQGLMQRLLTGEVRFPGFDGAWDEVRLGDHLAESRIIGSNGETAKKLTVKLYGKGVQEKQEYRPGSESTQYYIRRSGQFIYSKLDFLNGAFGIVPPELDGYETTLDLPAFDISETLNPVFLLNYVAREDFYKRQLGLARGGRKARRVPPSEIERIKVDLPSIAEQTTIALVISDMDSELETFERYLNALRQQKKGLMQRLLTGAVRVGEV